jgi:4,5-DOPA dioxygenase extradiol
LKRRDFLHLSGLLSLAGCTVKAENQKSPTPAPLNMKEPESGPMPLLFLGHGSPMNAIEDNEFVQGFKTIAQKLPQPKAILCVSAHWETRGTKVTAMTAPRTIHDFGGFPQALFDVQYPAPGSPWLAQEAKAAVQKAAIELDHQWGLDHGAWSVVKHLYPNADVPIIQMSLDIGRTPQQHFELAAELTKLRSQGVLIVGSGNLVHNLGMVAWDKLDQVDYAFDWAAEASNIMKQAILNGHHDVLFEYKKGGRAMNLAIPTPEHFLPLMYTLAMKTEKDEVTLFNDKAVAGALTMTSVFIHSKT